MAHDGNFSGKSNGRTLADLLRQMFDTISAKPPTPELLDLVDQLDTARNDDVETAAPSERRAFAIA